MESKSLDPTGVYKLEHTSSGSPYIAIPTRSPTPIYLTKYYTNDAPGLVAALNLPEVNLYLISVPNPYTLADAEWWVNHQLTTPGSNHPLQVLRAGSPDEDGTPIGCASLMPPDSEVLTILEGQKVGPSSNEQKECELGYWLHPDWRGKGVVKSAVKALLAWGKTELDITHVVVKAAEDNPNSRRVIESMSDYFVRDDGVDHMINWPEVKGGGTKKILCWRWAS